MSLRLSLLLVSKFFGQIFLFKRSVAFLFKEAFVVTSIYELAVSFICVLWVRVEEGGWHNFLDMLLLLIKHLSLSWKHLVPSSAGRWGWCHPSFVLFVSYWQLNLSKVVFLIEKLYFFEEWEISSSHLQPFLALQKKLYNCFWFEFFDHSSANVSSIKNAGKIAL